MRLTDEILIRHYLTGVGLAAAPVMAVTANFRLPIYQSMLSSFNLPFKKNAYFSTRLGQFTDLNGATVHDCGVVF